MESARAIITVPAVAVLTSLLAGCGGSDGAPTRPSTLPSQPTATIVRVVVEGPQSVVPGGAAVYAARAQMSDGSSRDVTGEVAWSTAGMPVLSISASGLASAGLERGFAIIEARIGGHLWSKEVIVVPAGTYVLYGEVRATGIGVANARVEVVGGLAAPPFTTFNGIYRLFGVAGDTRIRVTAAGYEPVEKTVSIAGYGERLDFELTPSIPFHDLSGTYRLTIGAAAACRGLLPEEARARTYTAVLAMEGRRVTVRLDGARFYVNTSGSGNRFSGVVDPNRVTFTLHWYDDSDGTGLYYPDVFEQLAPSTALAVMGSVVLTPSATGLSGALDGSMEILREDGPYQFSLQAACGSTGHQFVLGRTGS